MGQATEERMTTEIASTRENLSRDVDALYDKVSPSRVVGRRKAAMRNRMTSMRYRVMGSAQSATGSVSDTASSAAGSVSGSAQQAAHAVQRQTEGSPLAAGLVAFGTGIVIAALIPPTEKETRAAQRLTQVAKEHGQPVVDEARSMGQEVGQSLKEKAAEATQELRSTAQESVEHVKEEGQTAAQNVRRDAPGT